VRLRLRPVLIRDADAGKHTELFFVAAVATLLSIRGLLALTGYPQLGGHGLHIAHMLWGGLLMAIATALFASTLNRHVRPFAATLAGVGFGFFIDELGKFLTSDNDYFYQPTVAIIYLIFVLGFLIYRAIDRRSGLSDEERLANAMFLMQDMVTRDLDEEEKRRAGRWLERCPSDDPRTQSLRELYGRLSTIPVPPPHLWRRLRGRLDDWYGRAIEWRYSRQALSAFFIVKALAAIVIPTLTGIALWRGWHGRVLGRHIPEDFADWARLASSIASGVLVVRGAFLLKASRLRAYESFVRATLVTIFLTRFFVFFQQQFRGLPGLALDLIVLAILKGMVRLERRHADQGKTAESILPAQSAPVVRK
jgi:hypothetical protein